MMGLLDFFLAIAIVIILVEHDHPRSTLHPVDDDESWPHEAEPASDISPLNSGRKSNGSGQRLRFGRSRR
jgi:hypothetical protein